MCAQVEEFIVQLGIHNLSADSKLATKQLPTKKKLKTAKLQHDEQSADAKSSERTKESVLESKKKQRKLQHNEITSTTAKAVDWIANYQHRRHLLVKPGGKWQNERVSHSMFHLLLRHAMLATLIRRLLSIPLSYLENYVR